MKILIIGKNGQIGSSLIDAAKENNIEFIATNRDELDITDQKAITHYFENHHQFDFIINAAAYTNVDGAESNIEIANAVNHLAVKQLAEIAKKYNIPMIHLSTDYVFDGKKITDYNEDDIPYPINYYGKTKLDGENSLKKTWEKHIVLRVCWIFSEYGKNFVKTISQLCDKKDEFSVVCDQWGSPTSAHSIAKVIIQLCKSLYQNPKTEKYWGIYHYSDFPVTNWYQFAVFVSHLKEKKCGLKKIQPIETKDYSTTASRPKNSMLNNFKIKSVFGIRQQSWMNEVEKIIDKM